MPISHWFSTPLPRSDLAWALALGLATAPALAQTATPAGVTAQATTSEDTIAIEATAHAEQLAQEPDSRQALADDADDDAVVGPMLAEDADHFLLVNGVGDGSDDALAFGDYAVALGASSYADGEGASAFGSGAFALATNATATGFNATASGARSAAFGDGSNASGQDSVALGGRAEIFFGGIGFQYVSTTASGMP